MFGRSGVAGPAGLPRESRGTRLFRLERAKNRETLLLGHAFDVYPLIIHLQMPGGQLGSLPPKRPLAGRRPDSATPRTRSYLP
jgi:hypothetical protein